MFRPFALTAALSILAILGGCASPGPTDDILARRLGWFSYVGGEDIRGACGPGAPETYRLVYNAQWDEQVRTYDLVGDRLESRVFSGGLLQALRLDDPRLSVSGPVDRRTVSASDISRLRQALTLSGFDRPAPRGERLRSDNFYWTVAACRDGQFRFNAWQAPGPAYQAISFDKVLLGLDGTGVPVRPAREVWLVPEHQADRHGANASASFFAIEVAENGVKTGRLF